MNPKTKEGLAVGLDAIMGVCYGLRKALVPYQEKTVEGMIKEFVDGVDNLSEKFETIKTAGKEIRDFFKKPEVRMTCKTLKWYFEKYMERKEKDGGKEDAQNR